MTGGRREEIGRMLLLHTIALRTVVGQTFLSSLCLHSAEGDFLSSLLPFVRPSPPSPFFCRSSVAPSPLLPTPPRLSPVVASRRRKEGRKAGGDWPGRRPLSHTRSVAATRAECHCRHTHKWERRLLGRGWRRMGKMMAEARANKCEAKDCFCSIVNKLAVTK